MGTKFTIPEKAKLIGGTGKGNRKIFISKKTYKKIFTFAKRAEDVQIGGVLLGEKIKADDGIIYLIIKGFIEAKHSEGKINSITFSKETWRYIDEEKLNYPDLDVIGWVHTNQDKGYEITEYDHFFVTHMFEDEDAVEYVVDPVQLVEAFYLMEGNSLRRTDGFFLFIDEKPRKSRKEAEEEFLIVDDNENILFEGVDADGDDSSHNEISSEEVSGKTEKNEEKKDEQKNVVELDEAPTERLSKALDISNVKIVGKPSVVLKILISVLSIVVMLLIVMISVLVLRIVKIEKDIKNLYDNDVIVAKYINTGDVPETAEGPTEDETKDNIVVDEESSNEEQTESTTENQTTAEVENETKAENETTTATVE